MFLDEVKVVDPNVISGIRPTAIVPQQEVTIRGVYTLQGVKIANEATPELVSRLAKGIYIVNGKKVAL